MAFTIIFASYLCKPSPSGVYVVIPLDQNYVYFCIIIMTVVGFYIVQYGTLVPGSVLQLIFRLSFFRDEIACLPGDDCFSKCGQRSSCADMAYPKLVFGMMPSGE